MSDVNDHSDSEPTKFRVVKFLMTMLEKKKEGEKENHVIEECK